MASRLPTNIQQNSPGSWVDPDGTALIDVGKYKGSNGLLVNNQPMIYNNMTVRLLTQACTDQARMIKIGQISIKFSEMLARELPTGDESIMTGQPLIPTSGAMWTYQDTIDTLIAMLDYLKTQGFDPAQQR